MGMIIKNKTPYSSSSIIVELTQAEYDALSTQEKNSNVFYCITDVNGDEQSFQPVICSSEEREIGVFSDGKPLYERTFTKTLASTPDADSASFLVASNIDYIDTLVHMWGAVSKTNGTAWSGSTGLIVADGWKYSFHINPSNQLVVWTSASTTAYSEIAGGKVTITIRYTKTSDVAGSGTWTPQGVPAVHYSTDEQVIGTWIDGSTIYEKTFEFSSQLVLSANNWTNSSATVTSISNILDIIGYDGTAVFRVIGARPLNDIIQIYSPVILGISKITIRYTKSTS